MDKYQIIKVPDPVLKQVAKEVSKVDDEVRAQMDRMLETMYKAPGIGLAANQVGMLNRVIVMDIAQREDDKACLSIPGQYAEVERPLEVRVKYLDYEGKQQEQVFAELGSHCVQHEIDHLNGVLFIDHLSTLKRNMILKRYKKQQAAEPL